MDSPGATERQAAYNEGRRVPNAGGQEAASRTVSLETLNGTSWQSRLLPDLVSLPLALERSLYFLWYLATLAAIIAGATTIYGAVLEGWSVRNQILVPFCLIEGAACLFAAVLLRRSKSHGPVSLLMSFAFLSLAFFFALPANHDWQTPALAFFLAVFIAVLPAFPDGRYVPPISRYMLFIGPATGLVVSLDKQFELLAAILLIMGGSLSVGAFVWRYLHTAEGVARLQLKWAALGLAGGPVVAALGALFTALALGLAENYVALPLLGLGLCMIVIGTLLIPGGLIVSLGFYRLNDADAYLSRLSAYTVLATLIAVVWAIATALSHRWITSYVSPFQAIVLNGMLAAAVFAPSKDRVLKFAERRFQKALVAMRDLAGQLNIWQHEEDVVALAAMALEKVVAGVKPKWAAIVLQDGSVVDVNPPHSPLYERARADIQSSGDLPAHNLAVDLTAGSKKVGCLLLGVRSDGWTYSKAEQDALDVLAEPLGCALYSSSRHAMRTKEVREAVAGLQQALIALEMRVGKMRGKSQPKKLGDAGFARRQPASAPNLTGAS